MGKTTNLNWWSQEFWSINSDEREDSGKVDTYGGRSLALCYEEILNTAADRII